MQTTGLVELRWRWWRWSQMKRVLTHGGLGTNNVLGQAVVRTDVLSSPFPRSSRSFESFVWTVSGGWCAAVYARPEAQPGANINPQTLYNTAINTRGRQKTFGEKSNRLQTFFFVWFFVLSTHMYPSLLVSPSPIVFTHVPLSPGFSRSIVS